MRTFIIGAGASKAYSESPTNCRMPISNDFFQTFNKLDISNDLRVLIGDIINICKEDFDIDVMDFHTFSFDIEEFYTHIEQKLITQMQEGNIFDNIYYYKAYKQLIFLFTSVINEIQNGPISEAHKNLIYSLNENDSIITFNWDTLIDRTLNEYTNWKTDFGYCIKPEKIYRNQWVTAKEEDIKFNKLIKLHGSTNWITTYPIPDKNHIFKLNQTLDKSSFYIYENTIEPYSCYDGRYEGPYEPFSYFYYPPNILDDIGLEELKDKVIVKPGILGSKETKQMYEKIFNCKIGLPEKKAKDNGIITMPLIIPPVEDKKYSLFGNLFNELWEIAKQEIIKANEIIIIGYSFPITDIRTIKLFKEAFCMKQELPKIVIVNPEPNDIVQLFKMTFGVPSENITIYKEYFDKDFNFNKIN